MFNTAKMLLAAAVVSLALFHVREARADNTRVCVDVTLQQRARKPAAKPDGKPEPAKPPSPDSPAPAEPPAAAPPSLPPHLKAPSPPVKPDADVSGVVTPGSEADILPRSMSDKVGTAEGLPLGQRPLSYLKRLIEHFVTHEKGFVAVQKDCQQTIHVELYPLVDGWTVFARYSGTGREERIDRLLPTELSQFAERVALALLDNKPISGTINRENVLVSDSREYAQRIRGTSHFMLGVGTQVRVGRLAAAIQTAGDPKLGQAAEQWRVFSPVSAFLGYRGRFESWGLETVFMGSLGTAVTSAAKNPGGGHIDLAGNAAMQMHFLHYTDPRGLTSFYVGAGSTFELLFFQAIAPSNKRKEHVRSYLLGGGVDVDLLLGWEFMRASTAQFFLQAEVQLPTYALSNENDDGGIHSWFPATTFKLAVMF